VTIGLNEKLTFIKRALGPYELSRDGQNVGVCCPNCRERAKKKLAIHLTTDAAHCWVCGFGGRLLNVLRAFKSDSIVREYITRFAGSDVAFFAGLDDEKKELRVPQGFRLVVTARRDDIPARRARAYLRRRGLGERELWRFKLGVADDETMRRRVIMPSFDAEGVLNFYTARAIDDDTYRKYMNCDAEKKSIIFNELDIDWTQELTLVEGPFDLVRCNANATCLLGSSLSEDSLLFGRIYQNKTPVLLALDNDMQKKMWQRIARMLSYYDIPVRMLDLGSFKDVGEMSTAQFEEARSSARPWDRETALRLKIRGARA